MSEDTTSRIVLVGFMGAGKSTVGPLLAQNLSWTFREMDRLIEERVGLSIPKIFEERGEAFFRDEERRMALFLLGVEHVVIATGGGAFIEPQTRAALRSRAITVWLRAPFETLVGRAELSGSRPLAVDRATMLQLWAERDPFYREADLAVETSDASPEEVARRIVERVFRGPLTREAKDP
jgi:shikimate kinase